MEQKFHKCLSGVFQQLPADRDIASVIKAKACSVKINGMLQIDHNASVTLIEAWIHFQGGYEMTKEELYKHGVNDSFTHVDFMIGTKDLDIEAVTQDGKTVQIFKNGQFVI